MNYEGTVKLEAMQGYITLENYHETGPRPRPEYLRDVLLYWGARRGGQMLETVARHVRVAPMAATARVRQLALGLNKHRLKLEAWADRIDSGEISIVGNRLIVSMNPNAPTWIKISVACAKPVETVSIQPFAQY